MPSSVKPLSFFQAAKSKLSTATTMERADEVSKVARLLALSLPRTKKWRHPSAYFNASRETESNSSTSIASLPPTQPLETTSIEPTSKFTAPFPTQELTPFALSKVDSLEISSQCSAGEDIKQQVILIGREEDYDEESNHPRELEEDSMISPDSFEGASEGAQLAINKALIDNGDSKGLKKKQSFTNFLSHPGPPPFNSELPPSSSPASLGSQLKPIDIPDRETMISNQNSEPGVAEEPHYLFPLPHVVGPPQLSLQKPRLQSSSLPPFELQSSKATSSMTTYPYEQQKIHLTHDIKRDYSPCLPGTRTTLLKSIHDWVYDLAAPNVAILRGCPGTGKTSIAMSLVRRLDEKGILGANFFCQREKHFTLDPRDLWHMIAVQLIEKYPTTAESFALMEEDGLFDLSSSSIEDLIDLTIIRRLLLPVSADHPIAIVIDALDEFDGIGSNGTIRNELFESLRLWREFPPHCRLFITTRGHRDLSIILDSPTIFTLDTGVKRSTETDVDIRRYYQANFPQSALVLSRFTPTLPDELSIASRDLI
ncbi:hypothetical protein DL96DRAFT_1515611, partial [Flagelloscypha sp. PMI_526]